MSNHKKSAIATLRQRLADRRSRERLLLHPATILASAVLGIALVAVPITKAASDRAESALREVVAPFATAGAAAAPDASRATSATGGTPKAEVSEKATAEDPSSDASAVPAHKTRVVAFYADWGDEGYKSLERNIDKIDVLMPMWYHIGNDGKLTLGSPAGKARVMRLIRAKNPDMKVMPIVNNYDKRTETWNPKQVAKLMRKSAHRKAISKRIVRTMRAEGFDGVNVDLEGFRPQDRKTIVAFMKTLYPRANKAGLEVSQDVIVGSAAYDHRTLAKYNDYMIPMMYDEHWKTSGPGPIASQRWYEKTLRGFFDKVPPKKVIIGLGTYAYNWGRRGERAKSMTFAEATALARKKGKSIRLDESGMNSHFTYKRHGVKRQVWMLDAASTYNQVKAASKHKPAGYAFWRLGAEDPDVWRVLPKRDSLGKKAAQSLERGRRSVSHDEDSGLITGQRIRP